MTEVWRVETKDGTGPYEGDGAEAVWGSTFAGPGQPMPFEDPDPEFRSYFLPGFLGGRITGKIKRWKTHKFAFPSIEAVKKWFAKPADRAKFAALGYVIDEYTAPVAVVGVTQAVFDKTKATLVATIPLTDLDKETK